ncbi:Membrane protein [hydrothermal vent metagenome]|uniref:Membrane protein n=1 Tax=hydrothermal vent metagenome TaxID=652676 RepID=A0A3B1BWG9_9ZZZZ
MKFAEDKHSGLCIHGYTAQRIELQLPHNLQRNLPADPETGLSSLTTSFIITPTQLISDWPVSAFEQLNAAAMESICQLTPELIILGTGTKLQFPGVEITLPVHQARIGLEVMDTPAACRTFNLLVGDGRLVVAALIV